MKWLVWLVLLLGCGRRMEPIQVGRVEVAEGPMTLVATTETMLRDADVPLGGNGPALEVTLGNDGERWWAGLALTKSGRAIAIGAAETTTRNDMTEVGARALLQRAFADLRRNHDDNRSMDALLAAADDGDNGAIQVLATRDDPRVATLLLKRAAAHDVVALTSMRWSATAAMMPDIIALAHNQSDFVRRRCIEAARHAQGPLAAAWLFTLSTGHPDEEVQRYAMAALDVIEQPTK
jgi:hypothetical protein